MKPFVSLELKELRMSTEECKECKKIIEIGEIGWQFHVCCGSCLEPGHNYQGFICVKCTGVSDPALYFNENISIKCLKDFTVFEEIDGEIKIKINDELINEIKERCKKLAQAREQEKPYNSIKLEKLSNTSKECLNCLKIIEIGETCWKVHALTKGSPLLPENYPEEYICACCAGGTVDCGSIIERVYKIFFDCFKDKIKEQQK